MGFLLLIAIATLHIGSLEAGNLQSRRCMASNAPLTPHDGIDDDHLRGLEVVTDSAEGFGSRFLKHFRDSLEDDQVYSAISLWMALSLLYYGAQGRTEETMRGVLKISQSDSITKYGYRALIDGLVSDGKTLDLRLANKLFFRSDVHPTEEYTNISTTFFRSEVERIDVFDPKAASNRINSWCALKTNNCIKEIIGPGDINSNTAVVLVNAVYFKGTWLQKFDSRCTQQLDFLVAGTKKPVPMMYMFDDFKYGEIGNPKFQYVVLPFKTEHENLTVSMIVMLPKKENGLPALQEKLVTITSESLMRESRRHEVHVHLPKFKYESSFVLNEPLAKMGLEKIFGSADFRKISNDLSVSRVLQKAFITVDEEGAEAAAATAICCVDSPFSRDTSKDFNANHPFAFRIVATLHNYTVDLFAGQYTGKNVVDN